jgi:1-acyl-sn-glycerol-3-phosphate acyltransferase
VAAADHLQVPRQHGLFNHHGIDLGDGSVAHYLEGREILRSPLAAFSRDQPLSVVIYPEGGCSAPGITLRRAMGPPGRAELQPAVQQLRALRPLVQDRPAPQQPGGGLAAHRQHGGPGLWPVATGGRAERQPAAQRSPARPGGWHWPRRSLESLEGLRQSLQLKLDKELARAEARWGQGQFETLRRAAQKLADQLAEVEELEISLDNRLRGLLEAAGGDEP